MTRRHRPNGSGMEVSRKRKANGSPKQGRNFRGSPTEVSAPTSFRQGDPNYLPKILAAKLKPGLSHAYVYHDDWCAIFRGEECDCDPDVIVRGDGDTH